MITLNVNGTVHQVSVDPDTPLLWVLREHLGLIGTKYSCGIAECGACAVHVDGEIMLSCIIPVSEIEDTEITTIEGFKGKVADALRQAWIEEDVSQCGYCQPGQIMTAATLLFEKPNPSDADINEIMSGVLCRCGTYRAIRRAIYRAAEKI